MKPPTILIVAISMDIAARIPTRLFGDQAVAALMIMMPEMAFVTASVACAAHG